MEQDIHSGLEGLKVAVTRLSDVQPMPGRLIIGGYDAPELAGKASFEEVVHLLHRGRLPCRSELNAWTAELRRRREPHEDLLSMVASLPPDTLPMHALRTGISAMAAFDREAENRAPEVLLRQALDLVAQAPVLAAAFHAARRKQRRPARRDDLDEAAHFLYLLSGADPDPEAARVLDACFVLHADHGMNTSTFAARVAASTLADLYSSVTAAIAALKGPLHGGAGPEVVRTLEEIGSPDRVEAWVDRALAQKRRIMGFGHRIYKTIDPRAPRLRELALRLGGRPGGIPWIEIGDRLAGVLRERKNIHPNVDFYSAAVYRSLGIPIDFFPVLFAIARMPGWTAHVLEQWENNRLVCPDSVYNGPRDLHFRPIDER